ncbi:hypothetical protein SOCEGT47_037180 [Sorangium cellulosum]|jgi:hypothetical protein|uniref:Uncharacterized protein n=1 Tax=Sorangium cellulosum TaxID=56 RepID=A0A4P2Q1P9_SORCE|nr:hypothetical protein [Sorangium cellulosum]AUX23195.1 hypothetical protein SOCEGT47_037180 [Sorangium cellulosum]
MTTRIKAGSVSSVTLALVGLALGCMDTDQQLQNESAAALESGGTTSRPRFIEGGSMPYVLGFSPETGQILGGSHTLLIPVTGAREMMDAANLPTSLHPELGGAYSFFNSSVRHGQATGPFASQWWPHSRNGIADRWNSVVKDYGNLTSDPDNLSPAEKYDLLFYAGQARSLEPITSFRVDEMSRPEGLRAAPHVARAARVAGPTTEWELRHHGLYQGVTPEYWWGHCNGWAAYVVAEGSGPPRRDVRVRLAGGTLIECASVELGCILFRTADIEALMTEVYHHDAVTSSGRRCEMRADQVLRDHYGRPIDPACRDLNPGTMHVAMTGLLGLGAGPISATSSGGRARRSFVVDHTWHREVWSYPVTSFSIDAIEEVSAQRAAQLVCSGGYQGADCYNYRFNPSASRFVRVAARYGMISDEVSTAALLQPPALRNVAPVSSELHYVLELDNQLRVLGGEWIKNPAFINGINGKEMHPDYLWLPVRPQGAGEDSDDLGGSGDNPYISYSRAKALLTLSRGY